MSLEQLAEQVQRTAEAVDRSDTEVRTTAERLKRLRLGDPTEKH